MKPIGAGNLTFGQTAQLRLETRLIGSICTKKQRNTTPSP